MLTVGDKFPSFDLNASFGDVWIATGRELASHFIAHEKAAGL